MASSVMHRDRNKMGKNRSVSRSDVTFRAVIIGLLLIPANAYWITLREADLNFIEKEFHSFLAVC